MCLICIQGREISKVWYCEMKYHPPLRANVLELVTSWRYDLEDCGTLGR